MSIFDKKKKQVDVDGKKIELQPKPGPLSGLFGSKPKPKPVAQTPSTQQSTTQSQPSTTQQQNPMPIVQTGAAQQTPAPQAKDSNATTPIPPPTASESTMDEKLTALRQNLQSAKDNIQKPTQDFNSETGKKSKKATKPSSFKMRLEAIGAKKKGLEIGLKERKMKVTLYEFVRNMLLISVMLGIVIGICILVVFMKLGLSIEKSVVFAILLGVVIAFMAFQNFLSFPITKTKTSSKSIERDILFAARDMIISLRSGMPLFNAITSISNGYGDASKEFAKIVEKVQLGLSLEDAIDQTVSESKSISFRRIMLQAAVSIRAGADVVTALQSVIDQLSQERIIELRRYGQRLNAIAMFYMLFGIILPSMGIAVVTILTTFIAIFTVNLQVLEFALVGIIFLQVVFLKMITSSRPVFTL